MHFSVHRLEQCFCIMILTSELHVIYANPIIMIIIKAKINIFGEDMHCRWNDCRWNVLSAKWLSAKRTVGKMNCRQNELSAKRLSTKCTVDEMNFGEMNRTQFFYINLRICAFVLTKFFLPFPWKSKKDFHLEVTTLNHIVLLTCLIARLLTETKFQ